MSSASARSSGGPSANRSGCQTRESKRYRRRMSSALNPGRRPRITHGLSTAGMAGAGCCGRGPGPNQGGCRGGWPFPKSCAWRLS